MLTGFALFADNTFQAFSTVDDAIAARGRNPKAMWIDVDGAADGILAAIGNAFTLDPEAIEDCLSGEQRPRIDEFQHELFIVSYGAVGAGDAAVFSPRKLSMFLGPDLLITVHTEPMRTIETLRTRCEKQPAYLLARGTDYLFYLLIDMMVDNYGVVAEALDERVDQMEDASLDPDDGKAVLSGINTVRRELLELRRIATSQREVILPFMRGEYEFISDTVEKRFSHVYDHLTKTIELIDNLRELLHGVRDSFQAAVANRMNAVMKTLTIFASLFLPLTLIAGIYGMNTPLWPDPEKVVTFWGIVAVMSVISAVMLYFFHRRKWL